ncbi:hypothetical protein TNCV_3097821 [Trichonephila clavipes]|nr:hypothetical protein TNCV_3097821 [Trichonephila clavipes]
MRMWRRKGYLPDPAFIVERHMAITQKCDYVGSDLLGHTITASPPSTPFDRTQLRERDFKISCIAYTIMLPRCH